MVLHVGGVFRLISDIVWFFSLMERGRYQDGDTTLTSLEEVPSALPTVVSVRVGGVMLVVLLYEDWKARVLSYQSSKGGGAYGRKDTGGDGSRGI